MGVETGLLKNQRIQVLLWGLKEKSYCPLKQFPQFYYFLHSRPSSSSLDADASFCSNWFTWTTAVESIALLNLYFPLFATGSSFFSISNLAFCVTGGLAAGALRSLDSSGMAGVEVINAAIIASSS
eukprot:maker-scaffold_7-snap-gene-13.15-mRNA-1 protein AED:0.24 eAED:0.34 QI:0/0/0.5/1/0/0/2/611/125